MRSGASRAGRLRRVAPVVTRRPHILVIVRNTLSCTHAVGAVAIRQLRRTVGERSTRARPHR